MMQQQEYTVRFTTPAFPGNAEQSGQWRTPPFKALLRQWWRIARAASKQFNVNVTEMRQAEGLLFGNAWLEENFRKSRVLLRLDRWDEGRLRQWPDAKSPGGNLTVHHPEAGRHGNNGGPVNASLYLGYGPLHYQGGNTRLKANAAIQAGETAQLSIAVPENDAALIWQALWLMDRYGSLGGRSRNGWGSFTLTEANGQTIAPPDILRPWEQALTLDWPHAIGRDQNRPLIWQTGPHADWQTLMQTLARIKIGLRTQFRFHGGNVANPENRHWLSYPVTNHRVNAWGNNARLPNSLRFKVRPAPTGQGLVGVIFHVPCQPPARFNPDQQAIKRVWNTVHAFLDQPAQNLTRIKE